MKVYSLDILLSLLFTGKEKGLKKILTRKVIENGDKFQKFRNWLTLWNLENHLPGASRGLLKIEITTIFGEVDY